MEAKQFTEPVIIKHERGARTDTQCTMQNQRMNKTLGIKRQN